MNLHRYYVVDDDGKFWHGADSVEGLDLTLRSQGYDIAEIMPDGTWRWVQRKTHDIQDTQDFIRPRGCTCQMFRDTGGFRIADLCCPVHGVEGTDPGDGYWGRKAPS
jgi:hypothetical protein